jgi:hypothetical protein
MNAAEKEAMADSLMERLDQFDKTVGPLLGVRPFENRLAFVWQLVDSLQRIAYVSTMVARRNRMSPERANPASPLFDPIQAAILLREDDFEEACWLVFVATHCGRNVRKAWLLSRELYGGLGQKVWTWPEVSNDPMEFRIWLRQNRDQIDGTFGNHRKYESLNDGPKGTGAVVASYVHWVLSFGSHAEMFAQASAASQGDRRLAFHHLYEGMRQVMRFGRTGRFDYLTMLAKVGLADIEADSTYLVEATGPLRGARLFFDGQIDSPSSATTLETRIAALDDYLGVGKQALEDSMCNWQKSPNVYVGFRG